VRLADGFIAFGAKGSEPVEYFRTDRLSHVKRIRNYVTIDYEFKERLKIQFTNAKIATGFLSVLIRSFVVKDEPAYVADVKRWMRVSYELTREHETTAHDHEAEEHTGDD
jgi:hypothetical protein